MKKKLLCAMIVVFLNMFVMPFTRLKGIPKAEAEGRVVIARLVRVNKPQVADWADKRADYMGIYEYQVNGKKYRYRERFWDDPPKELRLLYRKDPSTARIMMKYGRLESEWKVIYPVCAAVVFVVSLFV